MYLMHESYGESSPNDCFLQPALIPTFRRDAGEKGTSLIAGSVGQRQ